MHLSIKDIGFTSIAQRGLTAATRESTIHRIYAIALAFIPVVMMYKVPLIGLGISTVIIALGLFVAAWYISKRFLEIKVGYLLVISAYFLYTASTGTTSSVLLAIAVVVHLLAISLGIAQSEVLWRTVINLSVFAAIAVMIQFAIHFVAGVHIPLVAADFCLDDIRQSYSTYISSGYSVSERAYRPAGFFLEPSHMARYCGIGLILCLLRNERCDYRAAIIITMGMLCTTSGIGMAIAVLVWLLSILFAPQESDLSKKLTRGILLLLACVVFAAAISQTSVIQGSIARLIGDWSFSNGYNAFYGRLFYWERYITPMNGTDLIWGYGAAAIPNVYFTGLMEIIYCHGIVGCALFYAIIVYYFRVFKDLSTRALVVIFGVLVVFADLTSFINLIFYFGIMYCMGVDNLEGQPENEARRIQTGLGHPATSL